VVLPHAELPANIIRRNSVRSAPNKNFPLAVNGRPASHTAIKLAPVVTPEAAELIFHSASMREVVSQIGMLSNCSSTILITGESGAGKELVARALHRDCIRAGGPFIAYNCSSIPREIAESVLFGHRKGAFTGAHSDLPGIIRRAEGGTIFLDEIGDLPLEVQPKLLRFLEQSEVQPVGASGVIKTDVRVIAATNRDLGRMVENGQFRADLWYRLNVIAIALPPLRERREDIPLLVEHFLGRLSAREGKPGLRLAPEVMERLIQYDWPGNVRELANELERLVVFTPSRREITEESLSPAINGCGGSVDTRDGSGDGKGSIMGVVLPPGGTRLDDAMAAYERMVIREAIGRHNGNITRTAKELGISRLRLRKRLRVMADHKLD
jgi:DNA-binding NtrC family response regulator